MSKSFNRKSFIKSVAIGTLALPVALRAIMGKGQAQTKSTNRLSKVYEWKMTTTWPPNFPIIGESCQLFADVVEKMSDGRIKIRVYGGGELVPALEAFDAVRSGAAEIGSGAAYYWAGKIPAAQFFASVPFGMNAQQSNAWIMCGGGMELWEELYRDFGLVPMQAGNTGVQMGGWFNREINTIQDLKGLKMRIPGLGGKVFEKAGGAPVLLAGGEIYTGLERGVIDATEWLGPFHDSLMGFPEIAKYYYTPGWHECGTILEMFINKKVFDELSPDLQAIIKTASDYVNVWCLSAIEASNNEAYAKLLADGVEIRAFSQDILDTLRIHTETVIEELTDSDPFAKKVYESYDAFRKRAKNYADITERLYYEKLQLS
ncbi:MAG: TRAP transporter substrate-binding protein [Bacteroidota bacterium]